MLIEAEVSPSLAVRQQHVATHHADELREAPGVSHGLHRPEDPAAGSLDHAVEVARPARPLPSELAVEVPDDVAVGPELGDVAVGFGLTAAPREEGLARRVEVVDAEREVARERAEPCRAVEGHVAGVVGQTRR